MLAIIGEQDQIIPNEKSLALVEQWGGESDHVIIKGAGHNTISHTSEYWVATHHFLSETAF